MGDGSEFGGAKDSHRVYDHFAHQATHSGNYQFRRFWGLSQHQRNAFRYRATPIWGADHLEPILGTDSLQKSKIQDSAAGRS